MGLLHSPFMSTEGLIFCLDAANIKSYTGSGTGCIDLSSSVKSGTLFNGVSFSGSNGGAFVFDGSDDYIDTTLLNTDLSSINCSLEVWFNTKTVTNNKFTTIAGQRSNDDTRTPLGLWIEARNSWPGNYSSNYGILGVTRGTVITPDFAIKSSPGSIINNTWYNVVLVSATTDTKLYINSSLVSTLTSSGSINNTVTGSFGVGCYGIASGSLQYPGNLSNQFISVMKVYNKALNPEEVTQNFNALRGRFGV